jgi:predicted HD phosphohydrolase
MTATVTSRSEIALQLLDVLRGSDSGLAIDDHQHSLQTATRAERAGADPELVVAALLHDTGKAITRRDHGRVAAEMLAGSVRPEIVWMVKVHQSFTAVEMNRRVRYRHARYRHVFHRGYGLAKHFVDDWDLPSRDPAYDTLAVEHFAPLVHEILADPVRYPRRVPLGKRLARTIRRRIRQVGRHASS